MSVLEKDIEGTAVRWAEKNNWLVVKVRFIDAGYPDRLFISPVGHTVFIEFKRAGLKPDPLQAYRLRTLRARSIPAYCCDSAVEAINILKAAVEPEVVHDSGSPAPVISSIRGALTRPRPREDVDGPRYPQDIEGEGDVEACINRGPTESDL